MTKQNSKSSAKLLSDSVKGKKLLTYGQPKVYSFGSLNKIQSGYSGAYNDGGGRRYHG